uniref:Sodium/potassium-transporting ATPase subunit beta-1-interacting protein n=1 Tax=Graphocephala atropunctata TaxID=36148 RepID=A0A1B6LK35_9HEMI
MGICSLRTFCLTNCVLQLILTTLRQIFDFLGYMWGPILANFFQIIFVIFGFFGVYQYRPRYAIAYSVWCVFWCCWNVFVACFYLNVFGLDKESDVLNLGTGSISWWEVNGPGCKPQYLANLSSLEVPWRPMRPDSVSDCLLQYHHLETAQALLHVLLATIGLVSSIIISWSLMDEDDTSPSGKKKKVDGLPPLYSIEYSLRQTINNGDDLSAHELPEEDPESRLSSPRPMTPRRVKRRSVNSRGLPLQRTSAPMSQYYSSQRHSNHARSSTRSSQRRNRVSHQNPVTRLIDQQQSQDGNSSRLVGHTNPMYQQSSTHSLDQESERPSSARSVYSNYHGTRAFSYTGSHPPSTFLSRGPPAYNLHSPNKTETVI